MKRGARNENLGMGKNKGKEGIKKTGNVREHKTERKEGIKRRKDGKGCMRERIEFREGRTGDRKQKKEGKELNWEEKYKIFVGIGEVGEEGRKSSSVFLVSPSTCSMP